MKVVVAVDSFKGSISSSDAGNAVKNGILKAIKDADVSVFPIADGGEGTLESLVDALGAKLHTVKTIDPSGKEIYATYGIANNIAIIEISKCVGLTLIPKEQRNPMNATTYGIGDMIKDAISKSCTEFIICIGGSATNDCGIGMLQSIGFDILDKNGMPVPYGAVGCGQASYITDKNVPKELKKCSFNILCDVKNPLLGKNGCTYVFSPQKGAKDEDLGKMDEYISNFSKVSNRYNENSDDSFPGSGAAGGLGFAFRTFLDAKLTPGIDYVLEKLELEKYIMDADVVVTGEGRIDSQTIYGKAPIGVAKLAKKYDKKVIAFCGCIGNNATIVNEHGIDGVFPIVTKPMSSEEAMNPETAKENLEFTASQVFSIIG